MIRRLELAGVTVVLALASTSAAGEHGLPLRGEEAEAFLRRAEVLEASRIPKGVSQPYKVVLRDGDRSLFAVWKTIDEYAPRKQFEGTRVEIGFRDSYRNEIAAYELDKLVGLGMVPPTVERVIDHDKGSLQLWVEGAITAWERKERGLKPSDTRVWNEQMHKVRLFHKLIYDTDYLNISNLLVDEDFRIYVIDSSRGFRTQGWLIKEESLVMFSRSLLNGLRKLTPELVEQSLGRWLSKPQINALLARRDRILARAEQLIAERGEETVLYD